MITFTAYWIHHVALLIGLIILFGLIPVVGFLIEKAFNIHGTLAAIVLSLSLFVTCVTLIYTSNLDTEVSSICESHNMKIIANNNIFFCVDKNSQVFWPSSLKE